MSVGVSFCFVMFHGISSCFKEDVRLSWCFMKCFDVFDVEISMLLCILIGGCAIYTHTHSHCCMVLSLQKNILYRICSHAVPEVDLTLFGLPCI